KKWGYTEKSSGGAMTLAALVSYGLGEATGVNETRKLKLTDLARRIHLDKRPVSAERTQALREAALKPAVFKMLWDHWSGKVPDSDVLEHWLKFDFGLEQDKAGDCARTYRETIAYAGLSSSASMPTDAPKPDPNEETERLEVG